MDSDRSTTAPSSALSGPKTTSPTNPSAHLLALPRELRDMIYPSLSHKVAFKWLWQEASEQFTACGPTFYNTVDVEFPAAPSVGVLAVHSRLHEEYLEA